MIGPAEPVVVFGGGALGSAVARLAAARGAAVTVASRHPREHVGWWREALVGSEAPLGWLPARANVVLAIGPGTHELEREIWSPAVARWIVRLRALRPKTLVLAGPAGVGPAFAPSAEEALRSGGVVVRLPVLLAGGAGWAGALAESLRAGEHPRVSVALPPARPLAVEDAARVILAEAGQLGEVTVTGPEELTAAAVVAALCERYGSTTRSRLLGTGLHRETLARLQRAAALPEAWDEARYGARLTLRTWVDRLPGPRRRRAEN